MGKHAKGQVHTESEPARATVMEQDDAVVLTGSKPQKKWPMIAILVLVGLIFLAGIGLAVSQTISHNHSGLPLSEQSDSSEASTETSMNTELHRPDPKSVLPERMKGAFILPTKDYLKHTENTEETMCSEAKAIVKTVVSDYDFNTVILPVQVNGKALYTSKLFESFDRISGGADPIAVLLGECKKENLNVFAVLDIGVTDLGTDPFSEKTEEAITSDLLTLSGYAFSGIYLDGYAFAGRNDAMKIAVPHFTAAGSDEDTLRTKMSECISSWTNALWTQNPNMPVGVLVSPVWAMDSDQPEGMEAVSAYSLYSDGMTDVKGWAESGLIDSIALKADTTLDDESVSFRTAVSWWGALCEKTGRPFYTIVYACHMGEEGWTSPDELALQWNCAKETTGFCGGAIYSLGDLKRDRGGSTKVLMDAMKGSVDLTDLANKLTINSPEKTSLTTDESTFTFQGTSDPHFPLLMNEKPVKQSEHGLFSQDVSLKAGKNTFTFSHKGKTVTYTITYSFDLLRSVSPSKSITLPGEAEIAVSAIAYKNATVTATVGGKSVSMKPAPIKEDTDRNDTDTDYINFSGTFTLPAGKSSVQNLGAITVSASYAGSCSTLSGGSIYIEAEEEPEENTTPVERVTETIKTTKKTTAKPAAKTTKTASKTSAQKTTKTTSKYPYTAKTTDALNVRRTPDTNHDRVGLLYEGTAVTVIGQKGDFLEIEYEWTATVDGEKLSGKTAYVSAQYVTGPTESTTKAPAKTTKKTTAKPTSGPTNAPIPSGKVLAKGKIMKISTDYAEVFSGNAVEDYSRPTNAYLPYGTLDVLVKTVYDSASGNSYYLLGSGRRVYKGDASVYQTEGSLTANSMKAKSASVSSDYTTLTLSTGWNVPYDLQFLPQSYPYINKMGTFGPMYDVTSFSATYIDITFHYTTSASGTFQVSGSPVISSASWVNTSGDSCKLRVKLKQNGTFNGYVADWENGNLVIRFKHPTRVTSSSKPLQGTTIVVDPGHGGEWSGTYGAIEGLYEKTLTLSYSKTLKKKLEDLGATVVMTRSTDTKVELHDVTKITRKAEPDLFISIHMNGVSAASANGPSVHYYNEYSYPFAKAVADNMYKTYTAEKTTQNRGAIWDPFQVIRNTVCPCILIECGFMTNIDDLELLIDDGFQSKLCSAIAQGAVTYQKKLG